MSEHAISASVGDALLMAVIDDNTDAIIDAFVEMYTLAQMGVGIVQYAKDVDQVCIDILTGKVTP